MSYMVMECHPGYAVVLDNAGRFLKVANLGYTVGQTVTSVIELNPPDASEEKEKKTRRRRFLPAVSFAACLCLMLLGSWQFLLTPYGSVRMQINPDVQITVNRMDYVLSIDGLNADGDVLIEGYDYQLKKLDQVSDDLADRAVAMGYLKNGGTIQLTVQSDKEQWRLQTEERIILELEVHLGKTVTVTSVHPDTPSATPSTDAIIIPIYPEDDDRESDDIYDPNDDIDDHNDNDDSDDNNSDDDDSDDDNDDDDSDDDGTSDDDNDDDDSDDDGTSDDDDTSDNDDDDSDADDDDDDDHHSDDDNDDDDSDDDNDDN